MPLMKIRYTQGEFAGLENYISRQTFDPATMMELPWDLPDPPRAPYNLMPIIVHRSPHDGLQAIIVREDLNLQTMEALSRYGAAPLLRNVLTASLQAITLRQGPHVGLRAIIAGTDFDPQTMEALPWSPQTPIVNMLFDGNAPLGEPS